MKKLYLKMLLVALAVFCFTSTTVFSQAWRSSLYPEDWQPGYTDSTGRFLHDFSYAGYHSGLKEIPFRNENVVDVTKPPYNADNTGGTDVTAILQQAIDDVGHAGGGVVFFPPGEYAISLQGRHALVIKHNHVVLRGAGTDSTFLKNTSTNIRHKSLIIFRPDQGRWSHPAGKAVSITKDLLRPVTVIPVDDASAFAVGDLVVLTSDCTEEFIREHRSQGIWKTSLTGPRFCRFIMEVDRKNNTIAIDAPTRYFLKKRDHARVYKIGRQLEESGMEDISIGNIQHPKTTGWDEDYAFRDKGTGPYEVHGSCFIRFRRAMNCWISNVASYRPEENKDDFHLLSNCMKIGESRFVTAVKCDFRKPQYEGGGGNGYMYELNGNDCLAERCHAEHSRHNYDLKSMSSNGNVIYRCTSKDPRYASDFHMFLSMANLFDSFVSEGDYIDARFRPWGGSDGHSYHGYSTTQSVIWNTIGMKPHRIGFLIDARQFGRGYVIGTSGQTYQVNTEPVSGVFLGLDYDTSPRDFVEGEGRGEWLVPQSLYMDQLKKRKAGIRNQKDRPVIPQL